MWNTTWKSDRLVAAGGSKRFVPVQPLSFFVENEIDLSPTKKKKRNRTPPFRFMRSVRSLPLRTSTLEAGLGAESIVVPRYASVAKAISTRGPTTVGEPIPVLSRRARRLWRGTFQRMVSVNTDCVSRMGGLVKTDSQQSALSLRCSCTITSGNSGSRKIPSADRGMRRLLPRPLSVMRASVRPAVGCSTTCVTPSGVAPVLVYENRLRVLFQHV